MNTEQLMNTEQSFYESIFVGGHVPDEGGRGGGGGGGGDPQAGGRQHRPRLLGEVTQVKKSSSGS